MNMNINVSAPTISSAAMLVELSISFWTARKLDKGTTSDVLYQKQAQRGAGSFNKNLLVGCDELEAIKKFAGNARTGIHYTMTLPWSDSGLRLLPTSKFFDYEERMSAMKAEFDRMVEAFIAVYDLEVVAAQARMGSLFDASEYPSTEKVRSKFGFRVNYIPMPEVGDWRVDMNNETISSLKSQYGKFYDEQTRRSMSDLWNKLHTECERFLKQLTIDDDGKKGKLYQSTIDHLSHLADMLEAVNFNNDPTMQLAQRKLKAIVSGLDKDDLVRNPSFREDTKKKMAEAIKALPSLDM